MTKLQKVKFSDPSATHKIRFALYIVFPPVVYFSGIKLRPSLSTEDGAEQIVHTIAALEKNNWQNFVWRDFQTHRGYPDLAKKECVVKELELLPDPNEYPICCGWQTIDLFNLIDIDPEPIGHFLCLIE